MVGFFYYSLFVFLNLLWYALLIILTQLGTIFRKSFRVLSENILYKFTGIVKILKYPKILKILKYIYIRFYYVY